MSRLDALIEQLMSQSGDALLIEAGNSMFLMRGSEQIPLLNAKLTNEHVAGLLHDAAPPDVRGSLDKQVPITFEYASPSGPMTIEVTTFEGRSFARVTPGSTPPDVGDASGTLPPVVSPFAPVLAGKFSSPFIPADSVSRPAIETWFDAFLKTGASDLHLTAGMPAMVRNPDGDIRELVEVPQADPLELEQLLLAIMPPNNREEWERTRDTDFAYDMPHARLRVNVFCDLRGPCATFRRIPSEVMTLEQLGLPPVFAELCRLKKGLVLVTGPTGSGKSTTLASMIDWINDNRADHIVTVEDPIEFVHTPKRCLIHQRQVGVHTISFARALRAALREDPDIILVGELRDLETIKIAIEVAETGHLVLGTLHTTTAHQTVDRIVDQFSSEKQEQVRQMLAESLKGIISQTLCKRKDGGRALALEVLLVTNAVANMIRERKTFQIPSVIQTSRGIGMRTLNDSLVELVKNGEVSAQEAIDRAVDKQGVRRDLAAQHIAVPTTEAGGL